MARGDLDKYLRGHYLFRQHLSWQQLPDDQSQARDPQSAQFAPTLAHLYLIYGIDRHCHFPHSLFSIRHQRLANQIFAE